MCNNSLHFSLYLSCMNTLSCRCFVWVLTFCSSWCWCRRTNIPALQSRNSKPYINLDPHGNTQQDCTHPLTCCTHASVYWTSAVSLTRCSLFPSRRYYKSTLSMWHPCKLCNGNWMSDRHSSLDRLVQTVSTALWSWPAAYTEQILLEQCGSGGCWVKN